MNKVFGVDLDTWVALNSIAAIIAAFGTAAAVIVALRLARRDYSPRMKVVCDYLRKEAISVELFSVSGTNMGLVPITVMGVYWSLGHIRPSRFVAFTEVGPWSDSLPKEISHSQQARVFQTLAENTKTIDSLARFVAKRWYRRFLIRSLRCGLYTTSGDFSALPCERVRKRLLESAVILRARAKRKSPAPS